MPIQTSALNKITENKTLTSILLFLFYAMGQIAFYSEKFHYGIIFFITFLCLLILILRIHIHFFRKIIPPVFILFLYFLFCFGFINSKAKYVTLDDFSNIDFAKDIEIEGIIEDIPKYANSTDTFKFSIRATSASKNDKKFKINKGKVLVSVKGYKKGNLKYGNKVKLRGIITLPKIASNPSEFNYGKFLNNKGILKILYVKSDGVIYSKTRDIKEYKNLKDYSVYFITKMNNLRDKVIKRHKKYIKSPELEILGGVVFGDDAINPPDEVKESFINSGLLHLLAASGLNVALILTIWLYFIRFLNIPYQIKIISGILIIILYSVMTGFPPSIIRASVMFILMLIGKLIYREANGMSLIFVAGLLILIFKPEFITNTGFQLSFTVTLGLISCMPCINSLITDKEKEYIKKVSNFPKFIQSVLMPLSPVSMISCITVPLIAQIWAAPIQAYYFNTFSTYSLFANILVVPFIGIISFFGFISTFISFIPKISEWVIFGLDFVLNYTIKIVLLISNTFGNLKYSNITVPSPNIQTMIIFYGLVLFMFSSIKNKFKNKIINKCLISALVLLVLINVNFDKNYDEFTFFDVGNGDMCLIKTKDKKYILIDTGKYIYNGLTSAKTILLEYFYDNNIKEIDTLVLTHYDSDHSGGLVDILKKTKVKNLIIPKPNCTSKNSCEIKKYIEENKISYIEPYLGQEIIFKDGLKLTNYKTTSDNTANKNDSSTVSLIEADNYKFLFLADIGIKAYKKLDKYIPNNITVLKASHHGAKNTVDDDMLNKLNPEYSIISTGKNPYGHPDPYTYSKLNQYSKTISTKEYGAIKFKLKDKLEIYRYNKRTGDFENLLF